MKTAKRKTIKIAINYFLIVFMLLINLTMKSQSKDNFIGIWENEDNSQIIKIYINETSYYGKLIFTNIPDNAQKINQDIIIQMKKASNKVLFGGTYYDLLNNKDYEIKLKLTDQNHFYLKRFFRFLNKRHYWHRATNDTIIAKN